MPIVLLDSLILAAIDHYYWMKYPFYCGCDWAMQEGFKTDGQWYPYK